MVRTKRIPPPVVTEGSTTRRSARQLERKAAGVSRKDNDNSEYSGATMGTSFQEHQLPPQMKRRFLTNTKNGRDTNNQMSSTATAISRLINKNQPPSLKLGRYKKTSITQKKKPMPQLTSFTSLLARVPTTTPGYSSNETRVKNQPVKPKKGRPPQRNRTEDTDWLPDNHQAEIPLKVEIQEGYGDVSIPSFQGPKKRGRKRKVDLLNPQLGGPVNSTFGDQNGLTVHLGPNQQQQRKRGRQSAATQNVKPRFPFCTICLSKAPPNDYIINYMSCPTEYQRMKRLFVYIYKDLKFPFVPFDLERENVFDYCDLPLCNSCILLYRNMYDSFAQIEIAKDHLKSKVELLVNQIQQAEKDSINSQQLNMIRNSPDALMNKYSNFRRRFSGYKGKYKNKIIPFKSFSPFGTFSKPSQQISHVFFNSCFFSWGYAWGGGCGKLSASNNC